MKMHNKNHGFSLLEVLGALAIGALMTFGLSSLVNASIEETKGQQAALFQAQVTAAAAKYISANYTALSAAATATTPAVVNLNTLQTAGLLSDNIGTTNSYGQTPCVLVLKTTRVNADGSTTPLLNALVVTEGGTAIGDVESGSIAAKSGQGGGFISQALPGVARGAYNSWNISASTTPTLANFLSRNCSGTAAAGGHLASALFYDGPEQVTADYLYRSEIPGQPELNQMRAPIHMVPGSAAQAVEGATDSRCTATSGTGKIAVDANGKLLTCRGGKWTSSSGAGYWREPVNTFEELTALPSAGNTIGDVRVVKNLNRAFVWSTDGVDTLWSPLAADNEGNLIIEGFMASKHIYISEAAQKDDPCPWINGVAATDSRGRILTCQNGIWQTQSSMETLWTMSGCEVIVPSKHNVQNWPPCTNVVPPLTIGYNAAIDTYSAILEIQIPPNRDSLLSFSASSHINRTLADPPAFYAGQLQLHAELYDNDTGVLVGSNSGMTPALKNESAAANVALIKALPANVNGYRLELKHGWSFFTGPQVWDEANYRDYTGKLVQQTPLRTMWNFDVIH